MLHTIRKRQNIDEIANGLTHALGIVLSILGIVFLLIFASSHNKASYWISFSVFGASLLILYSASTLYHFISKPKLKSLLNIVDHIAIFILIAGTYTPFTLVTLEGPWGWSLFGVVWSIAVVGAILKLFFTGRYRILSTILYLLMGWIVIIALKPLIDNIATEGLILLFAGGLSYSLGVIFYLWEKLPFNHAVWHLFVLAGSIFHYFAVLFYV